MGSTDDPSGLARPSTPKTGSSRGWSVWQDPRTHVWSWSAWCDDESRSGTLGARAAAALVAQRTLGELEDEARRRGLRIV